MPSHNRFLTVRAWAVHLYTSLGLITAFMAMRAIILNDARAVFIWLGIALIIDATDGTLARRWQVTVWAPQFDGRKLDDIVDYITYAFIPILFAYQFKLVPQGLAVQVILGAVLICASYGFCQKVAKTNDGYFTGFPNFWNLVVFYMFVLHSAPVFNLVALIILAALVFVPLRYLSYSTKAWRAVTAGMSLLYGINLALIIVTLNRLDLRLVWLSMIFPAYYVAASIYQHFGRRTA